MYTSTVTFLPSAALTRALAMIEREFANKNGSAKSMAKTMLKLGAADIAVHARYGYLARRLSDWRLNLDDTLKHLRFAYLCEPHPFNRQILMEATILLRWIRRHERNRFYSIRDALTNAPMMEAAE